VSNPHTRYMVLTENGYLGARHHNYVSQGYDKYSSDHAKFKTARIFTRKGDAERACRNGTQDRVVEVTISVAGT